MKVLLIGDANRITGAIADKLNKEGHRVFALMSSKRTHYRHAVSYTHLTLPTTIRV